MNAKIASMMALQELGSRQKIIELVEKNTHADDPVKMPLPTCPEMAMKDACAVCYWHDADKDACQSADITEEGIMEEAIRIAKDVLRIPEEDIGEEEI